MLTQINLHIKKKIYILNMYKGTLKLKINIYINKVIKY